MLPKKRIVVACLLITAICLPSAPVAGQDSAWPTKRFEVVSSEMLLTLQTPGVVSQDAAEGLIQAFNTVLSGADEWLVAWGMDPTLARVYFPDEETRREIETYLSEVAGVLESWGFPPPVLQVRNGRYRLLLAATSSTEALMGVDAAGVYHPPVCGVLGGYLSLSAEQILDGATMTPRGRATVAHEFFHAVQVNTSFLGGACLPFAGSWITEGTADAIGIDLARRLGGQEGVSSDEAWGKRNYARRLPVPKSAQLPFLVEWTQEDLLPYRTSSFWRFLAEYDASRLAGGRPPGPDAPGSAVDYAYLARMLARGTAGMDCVGSGATCDGELGWLDDGLEAVFGRSLQDLYPLFAGNLALYATHRVGLGEAFGRSWLDDVFDGCSYLRLTPEDPQFRSTLERFEPVSMRCWEVGLVGFEPGALLEVEVKAPPMAFELADLRAAVTSPRIQTYGTRLKVDPNDGWQSMTWTLPVGQDGSQRVLFTNVAGDPARSALMLNMPFTFRAVRDYVSMSVNGDSSGGSGDNTGPSAAEIEAGATIEFGDAEGQVSVFATDTGCQTWIQLTSEQDGHLTVLGNLSAPLTPGTYPIGHSGLDQLGATFITRHPADGSNGQYPKVSGMLHLDGVGPLRIAGSIETHVDGWDRQVDVRARFALRPGTMTGGILGPFTSDHPCFAGEVTADTAGSSVAGSPPVGAPPVPPDEPGDGDEPNPDPASTVTTGNESTNTSTGETALPGTNPVSGHNGGSSDISNGADTRNESGENLERKTAKLDFIEGENAAIRSAAQVVQEGVAGASLSSNSFNLTLALPQRELAMCGLGQRDPMGFLDLLAMVSAERGMLVGGLEGTSLQLDAASGGITLTLGFAQGTLILRGSVPAMGSLWPDDSGSLLAEVSGASLEGTINQHSFACDDLLDFSFVVTTIY